MDTNGIVLLPLKWSLWVAPGDILFPAFRLLFLFTLLMCQSVGGFCPFILDYASCKSV